MILSLFVWVENSSHQTDLCRNWANEVQIIRRRPMITSTSPSLKTDLNKHQVRQMSGIPSCLNASVTNRVKSIQVYYLNPAFNTKQLWFSRSRSFTYTKPTEKPSVMSVPKAEGTLCLLPAQTFPKTYIKQFFFMRLLHERCPPAGIGVEMISAGPFGPDSSLLAISPVISVAFFGFIK